MKNLITAGLLLISNLMYSQNIQIIEDDKFTYKPNNQSFVLFKVRVIDAAATHTREQIENGKYSPTFRLSKFDDILTKKWDTQVSTRHYIQEQVKSGLWTKKDAVAVYEWVYLLKTNPRKSGYYFETLSYHALNNYEIPIFRKIAPENNTLCNYGTIEITVNMPDNKPSYRLMDDEAEKESVINSAKELCPNVYNAYKDKVTNDKLKFFFAITTIGEIKKKHSFDYWSKLYGNGIDGQTGYGIIINSKKSEQIQQTHMSLNDIINIPVNFDITYRSEWKKGEPGMLYGLIVGNSDTNKYLFYTTMNGKSGIEGTINGSNEVAEISKQLNFSSGKTNKNDHKIEVRNKKANYYINNTKVGTFDLNANLSKAFFVGFLVKDKQKVIFDELEIIEP